MSKSPRIRIGFVPPFADLTASLPNRHALVDASLSRGIDHLGVVDHVSFRGGQGYDGLIHSTSLLSLDPNLHVLLGLYLLPLRHPMTVARQLATVSELAPGRLTFAVGIGGEDRLEVENCGVNPSTRGRRMDEYLTVLRMLLDGESVTYQGEFIQLRDATILPSPSPAIPILVGGRSDAAHSRAARLGDGWLGLWVSAKRFEAVVNQIKEEAEHLGRNDDVNHFAMSVWVGFGKSKTEARDFVAKGMTETYQMDFEKFERWTPYGTPCEVAEFLAPYIDAGCSTFNLMPRACDLASVIEGVAEVRRLLNGDA